MSTPYGAPYGAPGQQATIVQSGGRQPSPMNLTKVFARIGEQALWSTHRVASGTGTNQWQGEYVTFTTPQGSTGQGFARNLELPETNLLEGGRIPNGLSFKVYGLALQPYAIAKDGVLTKTPPLSSPDLQAISGHAALQWRFIGTRIDIAPAMCVGAAGGVFGATADQGAAYGGAGTANIGSMVSLNHGNGLYWVYSQWPVVLESAVTLALVTTFGSDAGLVDGGITIGESDTPSYDVALRTVLFGVYEQALVVG